MAELPHGAELFYVGAPMLYGKFTSRIRFAPVDGAVSSFFLWKDGSEVPGAYWNEIDIEKVGTDCQSYSSNIIRGRSPRVLDEKAVPGTPLASNMCSSFHTHTIEWNDRIISWAIDGVVVRQVDDPIEIGEFNANAEDGMSVHYNVWRGRASFGGILDLATLPTRQFVSSFEYSSYNQVDGSYGLQWRDSFENGLDPSRWQKASWPSPFELSRHDPANVIGANGMVTLLMGRAGEAENFADIAEDPMDRGSCGIAGFPLCAP